MSISKRSKLFLLLLIVSFLGACSRSNTMANASKPPGVKVKLATVQTSTIENSSNFVASLQSRRSVTLEPQIDGRVSQIFVRYGQQVAAGTPLVQINPAQQQAAVSSYIAAAQAAQANLQNAEATLKSLEAQRLSDVSNLAYYQKQYESYATLYAEGVVTRQQRDQYANSLNAARSALDAIDQQIRAQQASVTSAGKTLKQAQANIRQQQVQLQYYTIKAPFAGTVGNIPVKLGDYVTTSTQLTTVTQNQPLEVTLSVPIEDAPKLHMGLPVDLINGTGQTIGISYVFFISPEANSNIQSILVKALFDNPKNQLRANQYVTARVIWNQQPGILIPTTAVSPVGGQDFVYVAQQQTNSKGTSQLIAKEIPVQLGAIQGNDYQVIKGLQPGEQIVVLGASNLSNGTPIMPES